MKTYLRRVSLISLLILGFASCSLAGELTIGAKASIYAPPGASGPTPMVGGFARYSVTQYLSVEGAVEWAHYDNTTLMPITVNAMYHPLGEKVFNPYIGGGAGYYYTKVGEDVKSTIGCQSLIGISWSPTHDFGLNFELKYIIPDIRESSKGSFSYGGGITGTTTMRI